jgi:hypothetical protein
MKIITRLYYRLFKKYREIEVKLLPYNEANELLKQNGGKMEDQQWGLAKAEDTNIAYGYVFLARRERITK